MMIDGGDLLQDEEDELGGEYQIARITTTTTTNLNI